MTDIPRKKTYQSFLNAFFRNSSTKAQNMSLSFGFYLENVNAINDRIQQRCCNIVNNHCVEDLCLCQHATGYHCLCKSSQCSKANQVILSLLYNSRINNEPKNHFKKPRKMHEHFIQLKCVRQHPVICSKHELDSKTSHEPKSLIEVLD